MEKTANPEITIPTGLARAVAERDHEGFCAFLLDMNDYIAANRPDAYALSKLSDELLVELAHEIQPASIVLLWLEYQSSIEKSFHPGAVSVVRSTMARLIPAMTARVLLDQTPAQRKLAAELEREYRANTACDRPPR